MARLQQQMLNAAAAMSPDAVMKMWFGSMPQNPEQMREMFTRCFAQPFGPGPSGCPVIAHLAAPVAAKGVQLHAGTPVHQGHDVCHARPPSRSCMPVRLGARTGICAEEVPAGFRKGPVRAAGGRA